MLRHPLLGATNAKREVSPASGPASGPLVDPAWNAAGLGSLRHFTRMPDHTGPANRPTAAVLLERQFALADEAATTAFGERFAHAIDSVRNEAIATDQNAFNGLQVQ